MLSTLRRWASRLPRPTAVHVRGVLIPIALVLGAAKLLSVVQEHYPVEEWLFWIYAKCWLLCIAWALACLCAGNAVVWRWLPRTFPFRERQVFALGVGLLAFFLGMFLGGLLGIYGTRFAIALPLLMFVAGAPRTFRAWRRFLRRARVPRRRRPPGPLAIAIAVFGLLGIGMVYFAILTPNNVAFDAHFYHLGLAQEYAATRAIRPSEVGWMPAGIPQLASLLYAWAFLIPSSNAFGRIELAAHMEFVVFLWTLGSIPTLVRTLVPGRRVGLAWVALFLFPGIFLYDSNLSAAADHICAFWAVPAYLAFRRALRRLEPRYCALFAAMLAGALLTKYQGIYLGAGPILAIVARSVWLGVKRLVKRDATAGHRKRWWLTGPLSALVVGLVLTAPHWLKNWVWYADPVFPFLHNHLGYDRWPREAHELLDRWWFAVDAGRWKPKGELTEQIKETLGSLWTYSFVPNDWKKFHGTVPVFGSLFTLLLFCLPFLRKTRRIWALVVFTHVGIFVWYWMLHQDRYLQILLPWMAASVAGIIVLAWQGHVVTKVLLCALIGLQIVWGGDVYFIATHAMLKKAPAKAVVELLGKGYRKDYERRLQLKGAMFRVGEILPPDARVLVHEDNRRLGLFRPAISDFAPWQLGLRYGRFDSPRAMHDGLVELGVTHIIWRPSSSRRYDSVGNDLRFFEYVTNWASKPRKAGGMNVARLAPKPPEGPFNDVVAYLGCGKIYKRGLHHLGGMLVIGKGAPKEAYGRPAFKAAPDDADALAELLEEAAFAVTSDRCKPKAPSSALASFVQGAKRGSEKLWIRARR